MLEQFLIECNDCEIQQEMADWELARTMIEGVNGHSAYRYVYLSKKNCRCGLELVVEAQGFQAPDEIIVKEWHYRFFECSKVMIISHDLNLV